MWCTSHPSPRPRGRQVDTRAGRPLDIIEEEAEAMGYDLDQFADMKRKLYGRAIAALHERRLVILGKRRKTEEERGGGIKSESSGGY